jgi:hypothetical protein
VNAVEANDDMLMIRAFPPTVVPRRAFASDAEFQAFVQEAQRLFAARLP